MSDITINPERFGRKKVYNSASAVTPDDIIEKSKQQNIVSKFSFPLDADSFNDVGQSKHTLQILAYKSTLNSTVGDVFNDLYNNAKNLITKQFSNRDFNEEKNKRINNNPEAIFTFYMPSPIIFRQDNEYEKIDLNIVKNIGEELAEGAFNQAAALLGYPLNPMVEILYETTPQRKFEFEFRFSPNSEQEAIHLENMIKKLRACAAPQRQITGGILWRAPDTFDVIFLHNGLENTKIPKISECVCETIELDYTSSSGDLWSTFRTGHPVSTRLRMEFREKEVIDRDNIEAGF